MVEGGAQPSWPELFLWLSTETRVGYLGEWRQPFCSQEKATAPSVREGAGLDMDGSPRAVQGLESHGSLSAPCKLPVSGHRIATAVYMKQQGRMEGRLETPKERNCRDLPNENK